MTHPPLIKYGSEEQYRQHFEKVYCSKPIVTFDGIPVHFKKQDFNHCMFESSNHDEVKDVFAVHRAERIDWIKSTLQNPDADLFYGWDKKSKQISKSRRVAVINGDYVVIIRINDDNSRAYFLTAYKADKSIGKIRSMPKWK